MLVKQIIKIARGSRRRRGFDAGYNPGAVRSMDDKLASCRGHILYECLKY